MARAHVIPVPRHMTVEEASVEIRLLGCLLTENVDPDCDWGVVFDDDVWTGEDS